MPNAEKPTDAPEAPVDGSADDVKTLWDAFRAGMAVACPADSGLMALTVDAGASLYRLVCTDCGLATPWFESGPDGFIVRGYSLPAFPSADESEDDQ